MPPPAALDRGENHANHVQNIEAPEEKGDYHDPDNGQSKQDAADHRVKRQRELEVEGLFALGINEGVVVAFKQPDDEGASHMGDPGGKTPGQSREMAKHPPITCALLLWRCRLSHG